MVTVKVATVTALNLVHELMRDATLSNGSSLSYLNRGVLYGSYAVLEAITLPLHSHLRTTRYMER